MLMARGLRVVAIRHPMPYGKLAAQRVQRIATIADLTKHRCTLEEMEEFDPHAVRGNVIYAGVDYESILREAWTGEVSPRGQLYPRGHSRSDHFGDLQRRDDTGTVFDHRLFCSLISWIEKLKSSRRVQPSSP